MTDKIISDETKLAVLARGSILFGTIMAFMLSPIWIFVLMVALIGVAVFAVVKIADREFESNTDALANAGAYPHPEPTTGIW
jgi:membrane glycosyltransferase